MLKLDCITGNTHIDIIIEGLHLLSLYFNSYNKTHPCIHPIKPTVTAAISPGRSAWQ